MGTKTQKLCTNIPSQNGNQVISPPQNTFPHRSINTRPPAYTVNFESLFEITTGCIYLPLDKQINVALL